MTVRIDELSSDVTPEPEPGGTAHAVQEERSWDVLARTRGALERIAEDAVRTRSEGYGD